MEPDDEKRIRNAVNQIEVCLADLRQISDTEQKELDIESSAEYPNDERTDRLTESVDLLESAIDTIQCGMDELKELARPPADEIEDAVAASRASS